MQICNLNGFRLNAVSDPYHSKYTTNKLEAVWDKYGFTKHVGTPFDSGDPIWPPLIQYATDSNTDGGPSPTQQTTCDWHAGKDDIKSRWAFSDWRALHSKTQRDLPTATEIDQYCYGEKDFLVSCKLGNKNCESIYVPEKKPYTNYTAQPYGSFISRRDAKHCRCQTFKANPDFQMKRTGVRPGSKLELVLNVHSNDFWPTAAESEGVRVMVHDPGSVPDPTQGFVIGKSKHAEIALTVKNINRLNWLEPGFNGWGNCNNDKPKDADGSERKGKVPDYFRGMNSDECSNVKLAEAIVEQCNCYDEYLDPYFEVRGEVDPTPSPASLASVAKRKLPSCSSAPAPAGWAPVGKVASADTVYSQNDCRFNLQVMFVVSMQYTYFSPSTQRLFFSECPL